MYVLEFLYRSTGSTNKKEQTFLQLSNIWVFWNCILTMKPTTVISIRCIFGKIRFQDLKRKLLTWSVNATVILDSVQLKKFLSALKGQWQTDRWRVWMISLRFAWGVATSTMTSTYKPSCSSKLFNYLNKENKTCFVCKV